MLRGTKDLLGCTIGATDGVIGHVRDFYFDDETWVVRYLIVETGDWFARRKVLLSPKSLGAPNWELRVLPVAMTRELVRGSPAIDTDKPVSRQQEEVQLNYYGLPSYWTIDPMTSALASGVGYGGATAEYRSGEARREAVLAEASSSAHNDPHLRSCVEVVQYHVHATDGDIGHVQDLLIDETSWSIRYMAVDTSNWRLGHHVRIAPQRIERVSWSSAKIFVDLTRKEVSDAPAKSAKSARPRGLEPDLEENIVS